MTHNYTAAKNKQSDCLSVAINNQTHFPVYAACYYMHNDSALQEGLHGSCNNFWNNQMLSAVFVTVLNAGVWFYFGNHVIWTVSLS